MKNNDYLYLDHAASTPMRKTAIAEYVNAESFGFANSSGDSQADVCPDFPYSVTTSLPCMAASQAATRHFALLPAIDVD